jgi:hypothetical protein
MKRPSTKDKYLEEKIAEMPYAENVIIITK